MSDTQNLEQLLEALMDAEDPKEVRRIAGSILTLDGSHPAGHLALWELMEEEESLNSLGQLEKALAETRKRFGGAPASLYDENPLTEIYGALLMHLAFGFHAKEELERALAFAQDLVAFDDEGVYPGRTVFYRCLLDLKQYDRILEALEEDPLETPVGEHARTLALLETKGVCDETMEALLNALSLDTNLPFLILDLTILPEEDEELGAELEETFHQAVYLQTPWTETQERASFLALPTLILGSLTGRLEQEDQEALEEMLKDSGLEDGVARLQAQAAERDADEDPDERDQWAMEELMKLLQPEGN